MVKEIQIRPDIITNKINPPQIPLFQYEKKLQQEITNEKLKQKQCLEFIELMLTIRVFEEMIVEIINGIYAPLPKYKYIGPTHLSIGQEATSAGSIFALNKNDYITSSHRGHGDAIAKGYCAIKQMTANELEQLIHTKQKYLRSIGDEITTNISREELEEKAIKIHIYRMIAELFGKEDGYCKGVGGSMHIADFDLGHLGANAIVGGHMGIATGAAISARYRESGQVVLCLAGDGAYSNGISHESINLASMAQFKNGLMDKKFGVPIIFAIVNNQYAMTGQEFGEITGIDYLARRGIGYELNALHAEVVDGMNILAVHDAVKRARSIIMNGDGPALLEFITYRYMGHSLSDPQNYRDRDEITFWKEKDPIESFLKKLINANFPTEHGDSIDEGDIEELKEKAYKRNSDMAIIAASAPQSHPSTLLDHIYTTALPVQESTQADELKITPKYNRNEKSELTFRLACREALIEEMERNGKVVLFGEDIADHGGAFGVTNDILSIFGRERIFNTSISESGIVGMAIGMAMTGLRPVVEIMYDDFMLQAMDQIGNQAAKWHYMSGGQISIPMVIRTTIGGGKGYAGQHSQSLESIVAHIPGILIIAPSNPFDAKGLLKSSIRNDNPIIFFEHQLLYSMAGYVPNKEYILPIGKAKVTKEGKDITIISWSLMVNEAIKAASILDVLNISAEVIDLRTLIPLDIDTILNSVIKTGKAAIISQPVEQGSFASYIAYIIQQNAFDYLDAPIQCLGSANGIPPTASLLENEFLPNAEKLVRIIKEKILNH